MENSVVNNKKRLRFEIELNGEYGYIDYRWYKSEIAFLHTVVPLNLQGKGIGSLMAKTALEYAKQENIKILLYCPFMAKYVKEHQEYAYLVNRKHTG